jgi:hypothetical protein
MVFHVKNAHTHKRILPKMMISLLIISTLLFFLVQLSPVSAQDEAASLTGTISDQGVDTDGDGAYNLLDIGVEVNVTSTGTFKIEVSGLYDSSSNLIDVSNQNSTSLDAGVQVVYVYLNGTSIYTSELNPSTVSSITLYDESGDQLDSLSDISLSKNYYYTYFGLSPATLTGTIYDEGVDTDGDGAFDYLSLGVEVNVTIAATYKVYAGGLYDSTYNFVSVLTENSTYLDVGIHVVYLALNGTEIYASGVNPDTIAGISLYDENGNVIDDDYDLSLSQQYTYSEFQRPIIEIEFTEIERKIMLDQAGSIKVTNAYYLTNIGYQADIVEIGFPEGAYDFAVRDEMGTLETTTENGTMTVTFREDVETNGTETIYVNYRMPWDELVSQQNGLDYNLHFTFYEQFNSTIGKLTVSITLPKGAEFQSSNTLDPNSIKKSALQETISFAFSDVTPSEDLNFNINYTYLIFWASLYPTIWMGILAVAASAVTFFWKAPKPSASPIIPVPPKDLRSFFDYYEEKTRIRSELESLEERLRKGKIPRRRYKVRKKMLDGRLSTVSRNLSTLNEKIRSAGSKYANMMRQIEVSETNLEGAERDLQRVKTRYRRGEVSKGAYGKLLEEYKSRIEEAEATIDGVLLRLRE